MDNSLTLMDYIILDITTLLSYKIKTHSKININNFLMNINERSEYAAYIFRILYRSHESCNGQ